MYLILGTVLLILVIKWIIYRFRYSRLPVCVPGWPLVGSAWEMNQTDIPLHERFTQWKHRYGDIYTLWNFGIPSIVVYKLVHIEEINDKAHDVTSQKALQMVGSSGIIMGKSTDPSWIKARKAIFKGLKSYGILLKDLESLIQSEVDDFLEILENTNREAIEPKQTVQTTLCCIISTLMLGRKLGRDHPDIKHMMDLSNTYDTVIAFEFGLELDFFPWLQYFNTPTMKAIDSYKKSRDELFDKYLISFKETSTDEDQSGFIHLLMRGNIEGHKLNDDQIKAAFVDFLFGGIETTLTSAMTLMLQLLHHPAAMRKIQKEIDDVIGRSRSPSLNDKSNMPYLQASIFETLRFYPPVTINVRAAHKDIEFQGYNLPEKIQIIIDIWHIQHDPDFWKSPNEWKPERFLTSEGQLVSSSHENRRRVTQVFSTGKRVCPGQNFAFTRLYLLFAALLQRFDLRPDPDNPLPHVTANTGNATISQTVKYNISFEPRI